MTSTPEQAPAGNDPAGDLTDADRVAAAVAAVPGVTGLHAGSFGEVGTYLPGRRVAGVRLGDVVEVHLTVEMGRRILDVADAVVARVEPMLGRPVRVVVEDVTPVIP